MMHTLLELQQQAQSDKFVASSGIPSQLEIDKTLGRVNIEALVSVHGIIYVDAGSHQHDAVDIAAAMLHVFTCVVPIGARGWSRDKTQDGLRDSRDDLFADELLAVGDQVVEGAAGE